MREQGINHYFDILGLAHNSSQKQLKEAYKDLVKVWHPDRFLHDPKLRIKAQEKLKEINEAYQKVSSFIENGSKKASSTTERKKSTHRSSDDSHASSKAKAKTRKSNDSDRAKKANEKDSQDYDEASERHSNREKSPVTNLYDEYTPFSTTQVAVKPTNRRYYIAFVATAFLSLGSFLIYSDITRRTHTDPGAESPVASGVTNSTSNAISPEVAAETDSEQRIRVGENQNDTNSFENSLNEVSENEYVELAPLSLQTIERPAEKPFSLEPPPQAHPSGVEAELNETAPSAGFFSLNSTRNDVLRIQGTPDSIIGNTFSYGYSSVSFQNDRVSGWSNISKNLRVRMISYSPSSENYFTLGSTRADVVKIQGTPDSIIGNSYGYGYSSITFQGNSVVGWSNISKNLKVRMLSNSEMSLNQFTIGSSKDDVIRVQGTPDSIIGNSFGYGYSTVHFRNDRVSKWSNISRNLRVVLSPDP
ncbi:MAG: DnaJ domain-containing protein [Acidobacteria bacterium]|nr:DnaJ domain-containing protein [Acidobacteriota bacterium]